MKRFLTRALVLALSLTMLAGCGKKDAASSTPNEDKNVDLSTFVTDLTPKYETFPNLSAMGDEVIESFYPGLLDIDHEQLLVYMCERSPAPIGDIVLVQVTKAEDVDTVKQLMQDRINYMVGDGNGPGGAWYPEPTDMWENESRIVSNGNYVMLAVCHECDEVVEAFNALFA